MAEHQINLSIDDLVVDAGSGCVDISIGLAEDVSLTAGDPQAVAIDLGDITVDIDPGAVEVDLNLMASPAEEPLFVPIYVGPSEDAPTDVQAPVLLVLRDAGAAAGQTALVVREPAGA